MSYDSYLYALPIGSPYSNWGDWAALIMSAIDVELSKEENWQEADRPNISGNITELYYILPLLASCVAALEDVPMKFFVVTHQENQNVSGGTSGNDTYNIHPLNHEVADYDNLVALSGGNAVIEPGTWLLIGIPTCYRPNANHGALYNVTSAARVAEGVDAYTDTALAVSSHPMVVYPVVLTVATTYRLEVWTQTGAGGNGLGVPSNKSPETYAYLIGLKLS